MATESQTKEQRLAEYMDKMLPIVADSWEQLRGCDVYRLLNSVAYENVGNIAVAGQHIVGMRPDLSARVASAVEEIEEEQFGQ